MSFSKSDLVEAFFQQFSSLVKSKSKAEDMVSFVFDKMQECLMRGDKVSIVSFGTFEVKTTNPRMGRNPKTGETIQIPAKRSVRFKPGKGLKEKVRI